MGVIKARARYLLSVCRLPTSWWGMAALAAGHQSRVAAGEAKQPRVQFGQRVMVNITPAPRNAFLPRAMPATMFGPCEHIPDGMWVHQGGKVVAKVNVHVAGLTKYELNVVRATWDDNETPVAFLPPPDNALFDATAVDFGSGAAGSSSSVCCAS